MNYYSYYIRVITERRFSVQFTICLALLLQFTSAVSSQSGQLKEIQSSRPGLMAVQIPDLSSLEPDVREHLSLAQNGLVAGLKDPITDDKLSELYGVTGEIYHAYSLATPARQCYLNAARLAPKDFRWSYLLGKLAEDDGAAQEAINYYTTTSQLRPDYFPAFVNLGNIYLQLNRLEEAEANFNHALKIDQNIAAAHYGLGQAALSKRSYPDAARFLEKALALAPESNRLHYALAMAYRGLGKSDQATSHLALSGTVGVRVSDPLVDGLPDLIKGARLHLIRGRAALEAGRFSDAVVAFRQAVAAQPDSLPAHFNLGAALSQTGDLPGAVAEFEEVLRLDPNHPDAHYNLGFLLAQTNQGEQAIKHLQVAVVDNPADVNARFLLGQELLRAHRFDEAEKELSRVAQADPNNEDALLSLVTIMLRKKAHGLALEMLEKAHEQFPQKGRTSVTLAYLLVTSPQYEKRDGKRALQLAQAAYAATGTVNHGVLVAMAWAELGRCDEAAALVKHLTAKAAEERKPDLIEKLKVELDRYERGRPCRPTLDTSSDQSIPR